MPVVATWDDGAAIESFLVHAGSAPKEAELKTAIVDAMGAGSRAIRCPTAV